MVITTGTALRLGHGFRCALAGMWLILLCGVAAGWWRAHGDWIFPAVVSIAAFSFATAWLRWRRERLIREGPLPHFLKRKLRETYPHLSQKDAELVERGLRQFFLACSRSRSNFVSMPSRVVDAMWHEFILHTQAYRDWCRNALGRFLHHTPAEVLSSSARRNDGLRRAWYWVCRDEGINPRMPTRLPLLFALDTKLAIENGFRYAPDCRQIDRMAEGSTSFAYCGTDFGGDGFSGDAGSFGGAESSGDGGGGGDGHGSSGGDGCGGSGCGGGGD